MLKLCDVIGLEPCGKASYIREDGIRSLLEQVPGGIQKLFAASQPFAYSARGRGCRARLKWKTIDYTSGSQGSPYFAVFSRIDAVSLLETGSDPLEEGQSHTLLSDCRGQ